MYALLKASKRGVCKSRPLGHTLQWKQVPAPRNKAPKRRFVETAEHLASAQMAVSESGVLPVGVLLIRPLPFCVYVKAPLMGLNGCFSIRSLDCNYSPIILGLYQGPLILGNLPNAFNPLAARNMVWALSEVALSLLSGLHSAGRCSFRRLTNLL